MLWEFHDLINAIFDYYAAMGASDDVTHIGPNAFTQFANDCQLVDKYSEFCKGTHFDQLFIAVNASSVCATWPRTQAPPKLHEAARPAEATC